MQWVVLPNNSSGVVQISTATRSHDAFRWSIDNPSSTAWRLRISNSQVTDEGVYTCKVQVQSQNYVEDYVELKIVRMYNVHDLILYAPYNILFVQISKSLSLTMNYFYHKKIKTLW